MAEPNASKMPTAYDDNTTLLGDMIDQSSCTLAEAIDQYVTTIPTLENLGSINIPCYLHFTDTDEIIYAEGKTAYSFTSCVRGARGSTAVTHSAGETLNLVLSGNQMILFRLAVIAGETYQGLVGTDAGKSATPTQNAVYFATDTQKLYVCLTAGTWTWVGNRDAHDELNGLGDDDHTQYHTVSRKITWHDTLAGDHVTGGDTHDHGISTADGAGRVRNGLSSARPGTPTYVGELYYETDTSYLYVSRDTSNWVRISGAPTGVIVGFTEASITNDYGGNCPTGWSRYTALDGRLPKGAPTGVTSPLNSGGAATHTHSYSNIPAHTHSVSAQTASLVSAGGHSHSVPHFGGVAGDALHISSDRNAAWNNTNSSGDHTHTFTAPAHNTVLTKKTSDNTEGGAGATTGSGSTWPVYQEIIWCKKD